MTAKWPWEYRRFLALKKGTPITQAERERTDRKLMHNRMLRAMLDMGLTKEQVRRVLLYAFSHRDMGKALDQTLGKTHARAALKRAMTERKKKALHAYRTRAKKTKKHARSRPRV